MRLVVSEFVTLDGVMEDPGGAEKSPAGGWAFRFERGPDGDKFKFDELMAADALLLGRVTYTGFAAAWPNITDDQGFAAKMNSIRKYVLSSTLHTADWTNSVILRGNLADEVRKLKAQPGGDILVAGSGQLVRGLAENQLVDEYRLMVYPAILGGGKRLFPDGLPSAGFKIVEAQPTGGVLTMRLQPLPA
ncbi:MAG: dihydrofolate reductase family protein [Chloroflexi bacterium]|nr:dihydrofolate reductase family protein [Chloroflexota bacterium]